MSRLLPNFPIPIPNELIVLGYQFISGRFATKKRRPGVLGVLGLKAARRTYDNAQKERIKNAAMRKGSLLQKRASILRARPTTNCANKK